MHTGGLHMAVTQSTYSQSKVQTPWIYQKVIQFEVVSLRALVHNLGYIFSYDLGWWSWARQRSWLPIGLSSNFPLLWNPTNCWFELFSSHNWSWIGVVIVEPSVSCAVPYPMIVKHKFWSIAGRMVCPTAVNRWSVAVAEQLLIQMRSPILQSLLLSHSEESLPGGSVQHIL